jgi:hypothetical protein
MTKIILVDGDQRILYFLPVQSLEKKDLVIIGKCENGIPTASIVDVILLRRISLHAWLELVDLYGVDGYAIAVVRDFFFYSLVLYSHIGYRLFAARISLR